MVVKQTRYFFQKSTKTLIVLTVSHRTMKLLIFYLEFI